jgi:endonuclease/exonuclease/phosphatase family metal-dependent hydrolase
MNINTGYNTATAIQRDNVRVLHYNIHQGFNIDGYLDLEGIARVIEANGADIVSLNEVSRGWVINGSADTFEWLASRLGMKYKFFTPSADSVWGNAILSRYPLKLLGSGFLPLMNTYQQRSYLITGVDLSSLGIKNVTMFTTHLHDIPQDSQKRQAQIKALLELIKVNERKVIFGDFNSETGSPENNMMENAGFIDTQLALGKQDELTWAHYKPYRRIDYIWTTPDIEISDFSVTYSRASDHLPIALNIK